MKLNEILSEALNSDTNERKVLYEYFIKSLDELLEAKRLLDSKEQEVRRKIAEYAPADADQLDVNQPDTRNLAVAAYPIAGSWITKITYVLGNSQTPLVARQIINELKKLQPDLINKKIATSVYPTLSDNSGSNGKFIKTYNSTLAANAFALRK